MARRNRQEIIRDGDAPRDMFVVPVDAHDRLERLWKQLRKEGERERARARSREGTSGSS